MWWILGGIAVLFLLSRTSSGASSSGGDGPRSAPEEMSGLDFIEGIMRYAILDSAPPSEARVNLPTTFSLTTRRDLGPTLVRTHGPSHVYDPAVDNIAGLDVGSVGHVMDATAISEGGQVDMVSVKIFYP